MIGGDQGGLRAEPDPAEVEARRLTPARHARQGSYLASRGFELTHEEQIGRLQQFVVNKSNNLEGGRDEQQARHRLSLVLLDENILTDDRF